MQNYDDYVTPTVAKTVTCLECGTECGGAGQPDPYKHMLVCLHAQPDAVDRIRQAAVAAGNENGKRVIHLCDFILGGA